MTWNHRFQGMANSRPLFIAIYVTVIIGIVFSSISVFSAIFTGRPQVFTNNCSSSVSHIDSPHEEHTPISSPTAEGGKSTSTSPFQSIWTRPIWEVPPPGAKRPPMKAFRLTKALVEPRVKDNIIIVTFGNYAFKDFILNWVKHLTDLGLPNLLVGAMDTKLLEALYWKGVPVFDMGSHMSTEDAGWGTPTFHKMGRQKVILIDAMLPFGYELLMCDTDMVWLKNPLPYFARFPGADILTSSDQLRPTTVDDSLEIFEQVTAAYNIGIFHWRPTDSAKKLAKEWKDMLLADDTIWDQHGFNELITKQSRSYVDDENGLVYTYDGNLKLGILPASIFCNGHTYFIQAMYQQLRMEPYAVHTTFQFAGTEGKRHRLREGKVFHDEPEYYDTPGGFLSFKPSIPKSLLLDGDHNIESHFSLINYQIVQIRTALAIASLLNRTLVMPPLWCRLDKLWWNHPGVLKGTMTRQPFLCPLDHVFEVNNMLKELPEDEFGPQIDFREYSFLENPLLSKEVKESWLDVQLCREGSSNETNQSGILRFPRNSNEEMFKTVFSSFKNVKVIHFSSMQEAFQGFTDKVRAKKFRNRVAGYVGVWCCMQNHEPGIIYYDMYWDEKPNWKPLPPGNSSR